VSLFRIKQKDAKLSEKDAKQNSKLMRLSKTKQNKVRMTQYRLHEPLKTILNQKETCEKWASFASKRNKRNWLTFPMFLFGLEVFLGVHVSETNAISLCFA
jgi:hypothetical protein